MWQAIILANQNIIDNRETKSDVQAKVTGFLTKLRDYLFLFIYRIGVYLNILQVLTLALKVFKEKDFLPQ